MTYTCPICDVTSSPLQGMLFGMPAVASDTFVCPNCELFSCQYSRLTKNVKVGQQDFSFEWEGYWKIAPYDKQIAKIRGELPFHLAMSAELSNKLLRGVFADYLEEQGDERCKGYRALSFYVETKVETVIDDTCPQGYKWFYLSTLPREWEKAKWAGVSIVREMSAMDTNTRYATEERAVEVFLTLTQEQQDEIMSL